MIKMICIIDCINCVHNRKELIKGWIDCCDAFPEGRSLDFQYDKVKEKKECNNGIGYEEKKNI